MKVGKSRRVPESPCTNCGVRFDGASSVDEEAAPSPGDGTLCIYCGHLMVFGDDLMLRDPSDAEIVEFAGDYRILAVQKVRAIMARVHQREKDRKKS